MNEEQKKIIENIHKEIEDLMLEKAKLTLLARQTALVGNPPDNQLIEQLRKIDEQILIVYRQEVHRIKMNAKKLREVSRKEYGEGIISQDKQFEYYGTGSDKIVLQASLAAHKLYGDKTRIDSNDISLYNTLLEEMYEIQQEQNKLWNHTNKKKLNNTELEKMFRKSITNMEKVMPTLRSKLGFESAYLKSDIDKKVEQLTVLRETINEKEKRYGSQRNRKLYEEKKEARKLNNETIELNRNLTTTEATYEESLKTQHEMEREVAERRQEIQKQFEQKKEQEKALRRQANEERHQANLQRQQQSSQVIEPPQEEQIVSITKPKNKKSLKEKLKKVVVAIVATATLITGIVGLSTSDSKNKPAQIQSEPAIEEVVETTPSPTETEEIVYTESSDYNQETEQNENIENIEEQNLVESEISESLEIEETKNTTNEETSELWSTVSIGKEIYRDKNSAINKENSLTPYFDENQQYTIIGVTYSKDGDNRTILTSTENSMENEALLKESGYAPIEYLISTKSPNEVDFTNFENVQKYATGHISADGITVQYQNQNGRSK